VVGKPPGEGFEALRRVGLEPVLLGVPTRQSDGNLGYVIAVQEPAADEDVPEGTRIYLALGTRLLSFGTLDGPEVAPPGTPAPAVVGLELEEAMRQVTALGLIVVVFQPERAATSLDVKRQEPSPGEQAPFREVAIWLD
jgi:beta-lactam-binding protein with PASTA domain